MDIMTTEEYRIKIKPHRDGKPVSQQAIRKAIAADKLHLLPHVIKITKSGWYHLLHVEVIENQ